MPLVSDDLDLLRQYADTGSEAAFAQIVGRHAGMVYSAALRQSRSPEAADEITQAVFILLMRKAAAMPGGTVLPAWLFKATRYTALNAARADARRKRHERRAGEMAQPTTGGENPTWAQVRPLLDAAVATLGPTDRAAVVMRYFERRSLAEVGRALGISENAAQMRVSRALGKLRGYFGRRGVAVSATAFGILAAAHASDAAPPHLSAALSLSTLRSADAARATTLAGQTSRDLAWHSVQRAAAAGAAAVLIVGGLAMAGLEVARPSRPPTGVAETSRTTKPAATASPWLWMPR